MARKVGTRELKTRLGTYLRLVRGGETLVVTDRGRPVAELRPLPPGTEDDLDRVLREMAALGELTLPERRPRRRRPVRVPGVSLSDAVLEERREGW